MKIECIWEHNGGDVIFKTEEASFTYSKYCDLKELAFKSATDFLRRYESIPDNLLQEGSYDEMWSVRKVLCRFVWYDRIHAKAMWRMAICGE